MTRPIRIGVQLWPGGAPDYATWRGAVLRAEELGADVIFGYDHFHRPAVRRGPNGVELEPMQPDVTNFEGWTALASWAEITTQAEIGLLVTGIGYRNPDLLADMARTVDHISDGRLILGIGAGWFERDYEEYGYEFGTAGGRLDKLREDMPRIEARWQQLNPPPTRKIPVLIGGGGEKKTLRIVAQHADIWHSFSDLPTLRRKRDVLAGHCAAVGRSPEEIEISVATPSGDPNQVGPPLLEAGGTLFTVATSGPDYDLGRLKQWIAWRDSL